MDIVDGSVVGNETRYINHGQTNANVRADGTLFPSFCIASVEAVAESVDAVLLVNGDQRIGIWASTHHFPFLSIWPVYTRTQK